MTSNEQDFVLLDQEELKDYNEAGLLPQSPDTLAKILHWLQPTAYDDSTSEYLRHLVSHVQGTGDWLCDTEEYRKWHDEDDKHHLLWVRAPPGTGKSVIAAHQRARLSMSEKHPVLYFFFRQILTANRTPVQLSRDWIAQLLPFSPLLQREIKVEFLDKKCSLSSVKFEIFWSLLRHAFSKMPRVYCFIDALDEMSNGNDDFLVELKKLGDVRTCRLFITSRPVSNIVALLRSPETMQIRLDADNLLQDISFYIDHRVDHDISRYIEHRLRTCDMDMDDHGPLETLHSLIQSVMREKAQGSFLYTKLTMDNLLEAIRGKPGKTSVEDAQRILQALPNGLSEMYRDMLREHARRTGTSTELQLAILGWVTHSERPLRILELATAIDHIFGDSSVRRDTKATIRTACGPLLDILPSDVVGPVHHSFTEYLTLNEVSTAGETTRAAIVDSGATHQMVARCCVEYLLQVCEYEDGKNLTSEDLKLRYPFLEYALQNWAHHVRKGGRLTPETLAVLDDFLLNDQKALTAWVKTKLPKPISLYYHTQIEPAEALRSSWPLKVSGSHVSAFVGIDNYIDRAVRKTQGPDVQDVDLQTPLHYAADRNMPACVEALLLSGADKNASEMHGLTALHLAAKKGHYTVVDLLLRSGMDPTTPKNREDPRDPYMQYCFGGGPESTVGATAIQYAIQAGHTSTMRVFLPYLDSETMTRALFEAIKNKKNDVALLIISQEKFDAKLVVDNSTPLYIAASHMNLNSMQALLDKGGSTASEVTSGPSQHTPLHAFIIKASEAQGSSSKLEDEDLLQGLRLLVEAGCRIEARDASGHTALYYSRFSHVLTAFLLEQGADINTALDDASNPLHDVAGGDMKAMKFWIEYGFDIDSRNSDGKTPLHLALDHDSASRKRFGTSQHQRVRNLLDLGADTNLICPPGLPPLHLAIQNYSSGTELMQSLVERGADVNSKDMDGNTPLMKTNIENEERVKILERAGADREARNIIGNSMILRVATINSNSLKLAKLIKAGNDIHARNSDGASILHLVCRSGRGVDCVWDAMIAANIDFKATDYMGNSALHYAALAGDIMTRAARDLLQRLFKQGLDPNHANLHGQTPLHFAVAANQRQVIRNLTGGCTKANVNCSDVRGITPLHLATCKSTELVLDLLRKGADPHSVTYSRQSCLHFAALSRAPEAISVILHHLDHKSTQFLDIQDDTGRTALHYAARSGRRESIRLLLKAGACPTVRDKSFRTPLDVCAEFPQEEERFQSARQIMEGPHSYLLEKEVSHRVPGYAWKDRIPGVLKKSWELLSREISTSFRYLDETNCLSIRQCVQDLLEVSSTAICDSVPVEQPKDPYQKPKLVPNPLREALKAECEPMIEELLDFIKIHDLGDKSFAQVSGVMKIKARLIMEKKKSLESWVGEEAGSEARKDLVSYLVGNDRAELVHELLASGSDILERPQGWQEYTLLESLVDKGLSRALGLCWPALRKLDTASEELSGSWPRSQEPYIPGSDDNLFKDVCKSPTSLAAGLLLRSTERRTPNMDIMQILVEVFSCSDLEKSAAILRMASKPQWWHLEAVEYLVKHGANVNVADADGLTPLMRACVSGLEEEMNSEMIKLLLKLGADVRMVDKKGESCLMRAATFPKALAILLDHGADLGDEIKTIATRAIQHDNAETIKMLLRKGLDPNSRVPLPAKFSDYADVPLLFAAFGLGIRGQISNPGDKMMEDRIPILDVLLESGADPLVDLRAGLPMLHGLLETGFQVQSVLALPGLDLERRDSRGRTLLLAAASRRGQGGIFQENFQSLVEREADITATDSSGRNVFHYLLDPKYEGGSITTKMVVELLQDPRSASLVNAKCSAGRSPFLLALKRRNWTVAWQLMELGAEVGVMDLDGSTVFHLLFRSSFPMVDNKRARQINAMIERVIKLQEEEESNQSEPNTTLKRATNMATLNAAGEPALFDLLRHFPVSPWAERIEDLIDDSEEEEEEENDDDDSKPDNLLDDTKPSLYSKSIRLLNRAGLDVTTRSSDGRGALHVLATRSVSSYQKKHGRGGAVGQDDIDFFTDMLRHLWKLLVDERGLDPYEEDEQGRSALDVAAACGNATILEMY